MTTPPRLIGWADIESQTLSLFLEISASDVLLKRIMGYIAYEMVYERPR